MIPGTTPTFLLRLKNADGYLADTTKLRVDVRQQDVVIKKPMQELTIIPEENTIGITLSEEETMKFLYKKGAIQFQVHGMLSDGTTWKTYVVDVPVHTTLTRDLLKGKTQ